jgi:hypothetical protein
LFACRFGIAGRGALHCGCSIPWETDVMMTTNKDLAALEQQRRELAAQVAQLRCVQDEVAQRIAELERALAALGDRMDRHGDSDS